MSLNQHYDKEKNTLVIVIKDKFDFNLVQDFRNAYIGIDPGARSVEVDLRATSYMDSSALGMLLNMQKALKGQVERFAICNANAQLKKIFQISRFDKKFAID
ncbi:MULTISPECIES: STAS domain-containing protein [unclassified Pseudoalteromonas]|uniref:STAS domain-containing protein n=1 Tax=unclassified Pseudoalteromonas TaxID=194690 RepID=UPI000CF61416|nr:MULTISPECIES: STAS domain-containing protein [unclassified Pseudoalteromonas]MBS3798868.1 STAS domain-containing protein [Pseudoalteromonas sp. BDTF-M6]